MSAMTSISNSISIFDNDEFEDEEPIILKTFITKELYHGNTLKSRVEFKACRELPRQLGMYEKDPAFSPIERKSSLKKYNIDIHQKRQDHSNLYWIISFIFILLFSFILGQFLISDVLPIEKIQQELYAKVLNQDQAIDYVVDGLRELEETNFKILRFLTGPTGVGKSYLINILNEQISSEHIRIFYSSDLQALVDEENMFVRSFRFRLYRNDYFIIVLDDLKPNDSDRLTGFLDLIASIHLRILIFAVVNDDSEECSESSSNIDYQDFCSDPLYLEHSIYNKDKVEFNFLNESIVRKWLKKELAVQNVSIEFHEEIINELLKIHDIKRYGLKGLQKKLLLKLPKN